MNSIAEKFQETVKIEESKVSNDANFQQAQQFIDEMKKLGLDKKPDYTLPLTDTIGKAYYFSLNRR
jgi:hypothetical protein